MMCDPRHRLACLLLIGLGITTLETDANATEIRVLAPYALKAAFENVALPWAKANGVTLHVKWSVPASINRRILDDEPIDVVITTEKGIDRLSRRGKLAIHTKTPFASTASAGSSDPALVPTGITTVAMREAEARTQGSISVLAGMTARDIRQSLGLLNHRMAIGASNGLPAVGFRFDGRGSSDGDHLRFTSGPGMSSDAPTSTVWAAGLHWNEVMVSQMSGIEMSAQLLKHLASDQSQAILEANGFQPLHR